ncbi:hypothetical protein, partial [Acinetobacter haemolyticus]|uniref:hypothetical protein n=1 Tax=Acinetobacter haemolyticus TaxID=29430 RepID=UPI0005590E9F
ISLINKLLVVQTSGTISEPKFKKKRVDSYIESRLSMFKNKYENIIDIAIDKELQNFKNKANSYLIDQENLEDFKFLRHTLLTPFDCIFKIFIKDRLCCTNLSVKAFSAI